MLVILSAVKHSTIVRNEVEGPRRRLSSHRIRSFSTSPYRALTHYRYLSSPHSFTI